jgi:nucleoside-diphosphate-sugar epimerase
LRAPKLVVPIPFPFKRMCSIEKARSVLGWSPRSLAEGFADMVRFEREER